MTRRTITLLIIGFIVLATIIGVIYALIPRATIMLSVAPEEFTVSVNGQTSSKKTGDSISVTPGDITIGISHDGFDTYTQKISIKNGEKTEILQALTAQTDAARALLKTEKSQLIIQRIKGNQTNSTVTDLTKNYPLISVLPINDKYYTITPCDSKKYPNDKTKIAICITLFNLEAKQSALDDITSRGFKTTDYEIIFVDASYDPATQTNGGD